MLSVTTELTTLIFSGEYELSQHCVPFRVVISVTVNVARRMVDSHMLVREWSLATGPLPTTELIKEGRNLLPRPARRTPDTVLMERANSTR